MNIRLADLVFVKGKSLISREIERIEHSPYSHVAGVVKPNELVEAQGFHVTGYKAEDDYDGTGDIYTCDVLTDTQREQIVAFVVADIGQGYDYPVIGWEFVHYEFDVNLPYRGDGKHFDCSDLWRQAYLHVGIDLCPGLLHASPADMVLSPLLRKVGSI